MEKSKNRLIWTAQAQLQLKKAFDFIFDNSPQNAFAVFDEIITAVEKTQTLPTFYTLDKFKVNNDGSFRAFEKHHSMPFS
jgi:plasmid stabilization system protein ParE